MSQDCKSRVGAALRSGRDPLDAGQLWPTEDAVRGSYYLFYSGVKQQLPAHEPPAPIVAPRTRVVDVAGQGKGVVAARAFQSGELIAAERPILVLPAVDMSLATGTRTVNMRNWCLTNLMPQKMKPRDLEAITALHNAHSSDPADYAGIFNTNALSIPSLPGHAAPYGALCPHLARINHSCVPNAYWRWDLATFSVHLYAARPIADGEQLSINYVPILASTKARQDALIERYIFRCTCSVCTASRAARLVRDARRAALKTFVDTPWAAGPLSKDASAAVVQAIKDARSEEYAFADVWSPAVCYAARAALALGHADRAAAYAKRAAKMASVVTGRDGGWARVAMSPERAAGFGAAVGQADVMGLGEVLEVLGEAPM